MKHIKIGACFVLIMIICVAAIWIVYCRKADKELLFKYYNYIEQKKIYEACLLSEKVFELLEYTEEGVLQFEFHRLIDSAIAHGKHDWVQIFTEPKISIEIKQSIVGITHHDALADILELPTENENKENVDYLIRYQEYIDNNNLYDACFIIEKVLEQIKHTTTKDSLIEYNKLIDSVADNGHHEWVKIFQEPKISLKLKQNIIQKIHNNSKIQLEDR